jgi:methyltransferase (TIGR00027 family)
MSEIKGGPSGFGPGQPSRTSIVVGALRAFGAREPDVAVRNPDFLAERLITAADLDLIREHPISRALQEDYQTARGNREVSGMANLMLVRTRFVDDQLRSAVTNGAQQIVILGAGFDTRAYRFADLLQGTPVFELDFPSTQQIKKRRLSEAAISIPSSVVFAEIDFKRDSLPDVLRKAGYKQDKRTFFVWEGVSMYLTEAAVRDTLQSISRNSPSGSALVMDFAGQTMIEFLQIFPSLAQHDYTTRWGEPWTFGLPDGREREFFRDCGLELQETLSFFDSKAVQRYLKRSDGTSFGNIRGGPPKSRMFAILMALIWMRLTRRSQWYAIATLNVRT